MSSNKTRALRSAYYSCNRFAKEKICSSSRVWIYLEEKSQRSRMVNQLIMRVHKPKDEYKLALQ